MIYSHCETGAFKIMALKYYIPYSFQAHHVCGGQFLFFFIQRTRPVAYRAIASVFLCIKTFTLDWLAASIGIDCVLHFYSL